MFVLRLFAFKNSGRGIDQLQRVPPSLGMRHNDVIIAAPISEKNDTMWGTPPKVPNSQNLDYPNTKEV